MSLIPEKPGATPKFFGAPVYICGNMHMLYITPLKIQADVAGGYIPVGITRSTPCAELRSDDLPPFGAKCARNSLSRSSQPLRFQLRLRRSSKVSRWQPISLAIAAAVEVEIAFAAWRSGAASRWAHLFVVAGCECPSRLTARFWGWWLTRHTI